MKYLPLSIVTIVTILFSAASCYYDSEEALYPSLSSSCDTITVTFSGTITPILANSCLSCHSNATAPSAGNNIRLQFPFKISRRICFDDLTAVDNRNFIT